MTAHPLPTDAETAWVRYVTAALCPGPESPPRRDALDAGWALVVEAPLARAALTRLIADVVTLAGVRDSPPWSPRGEPESIGGRRVARAMGRAIDQQLRVLVHGVVALPGQPPALNGLRQVVDRWALASLARTRPTVSWRFLERTGFTTRQPSVPAGMLIDGLWHPDWPVDPDDVALALRSWSSTIALSEPEAPVARARRIWAAAADAPLADALAE